MINTGKPLAPIIVDSNTFVLFNEHGELENVKLESENDLKYELNLEDDIEIDTYRFLQYKKYSKDYTIDEMPLKFIPYMPPILTEEDIFSNLVYPMYDCINPIAQYDKNNNAFLTFWCNIKSGIEIEINSDEEKLYPYDKIEKIKQSEISSLEFSKGEYTRLMITANITFVKVKIEGTQEYFEIPLVAQAKVIAEITDDYPIFDFGGSGSGTGGMKTHNHMINTLDAGGFCYAVYSPSSSTPQFVWE